MDPAVNVKWVPIAKSTWPATKQRSLIKVVYTRGRDSLEMTPSLASGHGRWPHIEVEFSWS